MVVSMYIERSAVPARTLGPRSTNCKDAADKRNVSDRRRKGKKLTTDSGLTSEQCLAETEDDLAKKHDGPSEESLPVAAPVSEV